MALDHILSPLKIRGMTLKNRVARTAHGTTIGAREKGGIGERFIGYHKARARGGVGLTILEICSVHPSCLAPLEVFNPDLPDGYKRLVDEVKPLGMALMQQLWHAGHSAQTYDGSPPWAPSDIPSALNGVVPTPMTKGMIDELIAGYAKGTKMAREGGLDGVEIHAAHTYLPQQFLSPTLNQREDDYGGSLENRARFLIEALEAARLEGGTDFPISIRLSPDGMADGMTAEENYRVLQLIESKDLIDFINMSSGSYFAMPAMIAPMSSPTGYMLETDAQISRDTKLPRLVTGRFRTLEEADQAIRLGDAEMVSMVRATIADPNLVVKTMEGRVEDVRPCIACNQACVGNINRGGLKGAMPMGCAVNPTVSKEAKMVDDEVDQAETGKRVLIVGGGPAGMEAARLAALRGHKVTLVEASNDLGGQINFAKRAPFRHTIGDITTWQEGQIFKLGVDVRLSTFFTAEDVAAENPDHVIVATGSTPRMDGLSLLDPSVPTRGVDQAHVLSSHAVMTSPPDVEGKQIVVGDDVGHYEAIGVAELLLEKGAEKVTFITRLHSLAPQMEVSFNAEEAKKRLHKTKRFDVIPNASVVSIGNGTAEIAIAFDSYRQQIDADYVVLVSSNRCNRELFDDLSDSKMSVSLIGDARSPRFIETAIKEGNLAGRNI